MEVAAQTVVAGRGGRTFWREVAQRLRSGYKMATATTSNNRQTVFEVVYLGASLLGSFLILRWALNRMDPNKTSAKAKERKKQLTKRLNRTIHIENPYEEIIAQEVVNPERLEVSLSDIGGLDDIIDDLTRNIITPMRRPLYFQTTLLRQKRGVLLYGPPGTGKTMLAKALAKECGACFINLKASTLLSKWYGDTNKLVSALWTVANKIQPTIVFIDEVDSLLGERRSVEHEATTSMKTEFMQLWEGFETSSNPNVVVLGATNKRDALDEAVLRRFSLQYEVRLPNVTQREAIVKLMLKRHSEELGPCMIDAALLSAIAASGNPRSAAAGAANGRPSSSNGSGRSGNSGQLRDIAQRTEGFSGSDLNEMCSQAAAIPLHEYLQAKEEWDAAIGGRRDPEPKLQPLSKVHFELVLAHMVPPSRAAQAAQQRRRARRNGGQGGGGGLSLISQTDVQALAHAIASGLAHVGALRGSAASGHPIESSEEEEA